MIRIALVFLVLGAVDAARLSAQICLGLPGSRGSVRVGIASVDGSSQYSGRAGGQVKSCALSLLQSYETLLDRR